MNSLSTIEQQNLKQYWIVLANLDPELYRIKVSLEETRVNPVIIPRMIRAIANLAYGSGWGKVQVFMEQRIVTQIKPEESDQLNVKAVADDIE